MYLVQMIESYATELSYFFKGKNFKFNNKMLQKEFWNIFLLLIVIIISDGRSTPVYQHKFNLRNENGFAKLLCGKLIDIFLPNTPNINYRLFSGFRDIFNFILAKPDTGVISMIKDDHERIILDDQCNTWFSACKSKENNKLYEMMHKKIPSPLSSFNMTLCQDEKILKYDMNFG